MNKNQSLAFIIILLLIYLSLIVIGAYSLISSQLGRFEAFKLLFSCMLIGSVAGVLYCFRGVYLNYSVKDQWDNKWIVWYIVRPLVSLICGGVSYIFLKAGLLVLEAQKETDATNLGFYSLAFIAGMNVDNFISKLEDLADASWGIKKSRSSRGSENNA